MKISINDQELFTITDLQKQVICNDINEDVFAEDIAGRVQWVVRHKYQQCLERLKSEWIEKLKGRVESIPLDDDAFINLVFAQPDYMCRKERDEEPTPE